MFREKTVNTRKLKRLMTIFMAVILALGGIPGYSVMAASSESDFDVEDGVIVAYHGTDEDVVIPETVGGETVTGIADDVFWYYDAADIKTVVIPATVKSIGSAAFSCLFDLESVTFLGAIPDVAEDAFDVSGTYCDYITFYCQDAYMTELTLLLGELSLSTDWEVEKIGGSTGPVDPDPVNPSDDAFETEVNADGTVTISKYNVPEGGVSAVTIPETIDGKTVTGIGENAFESAFTMKMEVTVKLPGTITSIGAHAFDNCRGLKAIQLSENLESIGAYAFYYCNALESIELPEGLEVIGSAAFQYCNSLTEVTIPASATDVAVTDSTKNDFAFNMCSGITKFQVAEGNPKYCNDDEGVLFSKDMTTLLAYPLGRTATSYAIPEGVKTIGNAAFKQYQGGSCALTSVSFPNSLETVENNAFMSQSLTEISVPASVKEWGSGVFQLNANLKTVHINEGITEIPAYFFYGLDNVTEITLPSTLKVIGERAFDRCNITSIDLPDGLEEIGEEAFECSKLTTLTIPASVKKIGDRAFYISKSLTDISFEEGDEPLDLGKYTFNGCHGLTSVNLPERVTVLDDGVFSHCYNLKEIEMPAVVELKDNVFAGSSFEKIALSDKITSMGSCTFKDCYYLTSATLPAKLEQLGTCTFENCSSLSQVNLPDTIQITSVPQDTFWGCESLTALVLPASIKATEACAFSKCKELTTIEVKNTEDMFTRSLFDCFDLDGDAEGIAGYWDGEYYVYTGEDIIQDNSNGANDALDEVNKEGEKLEADQDGAVLTTASAASASLLCGCSAGTGGRFAASANPTFRYLAAASNTPADDGKNDNNNGNNNNNAGNAQNSNAAGAGNNTNNNANNNGGKGTYYNAVKTDDPSSVGLWVSLMIGSFALGGCVIVYGKKRI